MTCCCFEIIIAATLNRLIGIVIVLCEHFLKWTKFKKVKKFYHSCLHKNKDGSKKLFQKGDQCCLPTNSPFWKYAWDITSGVRTRSQEKEQEKVTIEEFNHYFQNLWNIRRWLDASDSEVKILSEDDEIYIVRD